MATMKKPAKKMQMGGKMAPTPKKFIPKGPNKDIKKTFEVDTSSSKNSDSSKFYKPIKKGEGKGLKKGGVVKAKNGKSFPDLNKDGKITKADVLVGRGVIKAKKGAKVGAKKKAGVHKMPDGSMMKNSMMKSGGKMKKCEYGCK